MGDGGILPYVCQVLFWLIHSHTWDHENLMYLPSRMQGRGCLLRTLARSRVCSNTQDLETCNLWASCSGVRMSVGSSRAGCTMPSFAAVATVPLLAPLPF